MAQTVQQLSPQAAGLSATLQSRDEANTAFAPTNAAFAALEQKLDVTQAALLANTPLVTKVCSQPACPVGHAHQPGSRCWSSQAPGLRIADI